MSEHRRKPPQSGGRAAARRGTSGTPGAPSGRRAAPREGGGPPPPPPPPSRPPVPPGAGRGTGPGTGAGAAGKPGAGDGRGGEEPYQGRAAARRAAQRSGPFGGSGGGRRRAGGAAAGSGAAAGAGAAAGSGSGPGAGGGRGRGSGGGRGPGGTSGPGGRSDRGRGGPPPKKKFIDYPRAGKQGARRFVPSWKQVTGSIIGFFGLVMVAAGIGYALVDVPNPQAAATAQNNVYLWSDGTQMAATGGEANRQNIDYAQIPKSMRTAVMSAENKTFETDRGVDPKGIARAVGKMATGGETQGGSTITQQYVKNNFLSQDQTLKRKVQELFISVKVGATRSKQEIMAGYLNTAYYGRNAYGIQAASRAYFNKDAAKLKPDQTAFLAALLKGATYYDPAGQVTVDPAATPKANTERVTKRWNWILTEQVKDGHLSAQDRSKYKKLPKLQNPRSNAQLGGQTGYLIELAKSYVLQNSDETGITKEDLTKGGYEIHTTFDKGKVKKLENAVKKVYDANIDPDKRPETDKHVQFGGASVSPKTGAIEAIYGGSDYTKHFTNNADVTGAQVGSTFKPFVLAAAMRDGVRNRDLDPDQGPDERTIVNPDRTIYSAKNKLKIRNYDDSIWENEEGKQWEQKNDGGQSLNAPTYRVDLREAMRESVNSAYVQLGMDVGLSKVKQAAIDAGIKEGSFAGSDYPSFSLGVSSPSAIRMAGSYATFADSGKQREPYSVKEIKKGGSSEWEHPEEVRTAFEPEVADNVTDVLRTVVDKGTGTNAKLADRPAAGKTGTTDGNKSAWFVGYTPQLSTAISMYRMDDNEKSDDRQFLEMYGTGGEKEIHGASFPSEIWHDYMTDALKGEGVIPFQEPMPIGEAVDDMPKPTPTVTPSEEPSESASPSESTSPSPSDSPSPSESCNMWGICEDAGGMNGGPGGEESTPPPGGGETTEPGDTRGNGNGGIFGGGG